MNTIEYAAEVYDQDGSGDYFYKVFVSDGGIVTVKYIEKGRIEGASDRMDFPSHMVADVAKALLKVVELNKGIV